ncbi:MAG: hypothetical protein ABI461_12160 [Polyangiaceae bacterium]
MNEKNTKSPADVKPTERGGVEGEGSYTATHNYDKGVEQSVKKGNSEQLGRDAQKALDGKDGDELRAADAAAKAGKTGKN